MTSAQDPDTGGLPAARPAPPIPASRAARPLAFRDLLLALLVIAIWGTNFVVIRIGLDHLPPLLFATLRYLFVLVPAVFFVARPRVSWANLAAYGFLGGVGQFGLLYLAMEGHISPGLASLVIQMQVFFTLALAVPLLGERVGGFQTVALLVASVGIVVIAAHTDRATTPVGLALVLVAALCWACANLLVKKSGAPDMFAYVVWASLFAAPVLLVLSLVVEGPAAVLAGVAGTRLSGWIIVLWQAFGNALFGFAAWGWLLARYPAPTIAPLAMLVPVFGMGAATLWLGESLPPWKLAAGSLVLGGLALNTFGPKGRGAA